MQKLLDRFTQNSLQRWYMGLETVDFCGNWNGVTLGLEYRVTVTVGAQPYSGWKYVLHGVCLFATSPILAQMHSSECQFPLYNYPYLNRPSYGGST